MTKAKSRIHLKRQSTLKKMMKTTEQAIPVIGEGLKTVGNTAKVTVVKSAPVVEKGASIVYGTLATGFDLGIKGAKTVAKGISNRRSSRRRKHGRKTIKRRTSGR
jgi:hypothetical protein